MARNDFLEARKLLAYLGWTHTIPTTPNIDGVVAWSTQVPIVSTITKREMATPRQVEEAPMWGENLDELDRGTLRVSQPYHTQWVRGMHPLEWAMSQIRGLDSRYVIDYDGDIPPMPEAESLAQLQEVTSERSHLHDDRIMMAQHAREKGASVKEISEALGVGEQAVYKILRRTDIPGFTAVSGEPLAELRRIVERIEKRTQQRDQLIRDIKALGVNLETIGKFSELSRAGVHKIVAQK